ncbi:hypothetical protein AVEN_241575-1 [Araneus ventricosus]|uniref:Uncharacterized protein n=1 Tax=Araneus ventricosus TaxID=182803 RepID=A0A4Y2H7P5_ARAVE|nr:hypothetical protein AVEN_241575-1 [Araneus ventricosus]
MLNRDLSGKSTWSQCSGVQLRYSWAQCNRALTCAGDKGTQITGHRAKSPPSCSLRDTVLRDMGLPAAAESCDASCRAVSVLRHLAHCNRKRSSAVVVILRRLIPLVMVPQPMDDTTMHTQLSGNSTLSFTSLQHTDSPPTHLIVQFLLLMLSALAISDSAELSLLAN